MGVSQFKLYDWGDAGAPILTAWSGTFVSVLDACLVNGYGTKTPAGWLKPIANDGSVGCWKQPSGSGCTLFVNDAAPSGSMTSSAYTADAGGASGTREAWATGWEYLLGFTSSFASMGSGSGQFPILSPEIICKSGSVLWKKSPYQDNTRAIPWMIYADDRTFYLFVMAPCGDDTYWNLYGFGDIYSYKSTPDTSKCTIIGRIEHRASIIYSTDPILIGTMPSYTAAGQFISRNLANTTTSVLITKVTNMGLMSFDNGGVSSDGQGYTTGLAYVNESINYNYITPFQISEPRTTPPFLRGEYRGLYGSGLRHFLLYDGMYISGSNEYAGKVFRVFTMGAATEKAILLLETSNTVRYNDT